MNDGTWSKRIAVGVPHVFTWATGRGQAIAPTMDELVADAEHSRGDGLSSPSPSFVGRFTAFSSLKFALMELAPTLRANYPSKTSYPSPQTLPHTRVFWLATGLVTLLVLLFSAYFIFYLTGRQDAYFTNAEDLGIMDQAIWNTLHGHLFHQSICNIVSDTNCYSLQGITRFAIHFEPILFPISLLYLIWPTPKTLLVLQTLVVASGAFPAFWLARLRLRNEWAAVAIALLYLLYPAQQNAVIFDFHAVTLTSALLLFTLYFMYTRRTAWLFIFAILAMACKEEIPLLVAFLGLWSMLLQRRWRSGLLLILLALAWTCLALFVIHLNSPTGQSLLASRYAYLGNNPLQIAHTFFVHPPGILKSHALDRAHRTYLASLFAPAGYLPLLAPWILVLALPTLALNLLSSDPGMYSGLFQYNAELVPILIFATIEAMVLIPWLVQGLLRVGFLRACHGSLIFPGIGSLIPTRGDPRVPSLPNPAPAPTERCPFPAPLPRYLRFMVLTMMLIYVLSAVIREDYTGNAMPFAQGFRWPQITAHTELAQHFIDMIPSTASVSAQSRLVPHLSQRLNVYMFPYADDRAAYILLDVTGDKYPYFNVQAYTREVKKVLQSRNYGILASGNGYFLLKRGLPAPGVLPYFLSFP